MIRKAISKKMGCFPHSSPTRWQGSSVRNSFGTDLTLPKWHTKGLNFILLWLTLPFIVIKISTPSWSVIVEFTEKLLTVYFLNHYSTKKGKQWLFTRFTFPHRLIHIYPLNSIHVKPYPRNQRWLWVCVSVILHDLYILSLASWKLLCDWHLEWLTTKKTCRYTVQTEIAK